MDFRKDFVWGVAASAYQIEGAVKEDGRSETVSHYEGFPKTAIVLPVVIDG